MPECNIAEMRRRRVAAIQKPRNWLHAELCHFLLINRIGWNEVGGDKANALHQIVGEVRSEVCVNLIHNGLQRLLT